MQFRGLIFFLTLLISMISPAQIPLSIRRADPPINTVREFCRLDFLGARLAPETWSRMKPLTTWKENPDWHALTVVSRFDMGEVTQSFHSARVSVHYQVLGRFTPGMGFTPDAAPQEVKFQLKETDGEWHVDTVDPEITPHISKQRAVQWLQAALARETDAGNRASIETALRQLQGTAAAPQP